MVEHKVHGIELNKEDSFLDYSDWWSKYFESLKGKEELKVENDTKNYLKKGSKNLTRSDSIWRSFKEKTINYLKRSSSQAIDEISSNEAIF